MLENPAQSLQLVCTAMAKGQNKRCVARHAYRVVVHLLCRFPVVLSPADIAEEASEYHPLLSLAVISQPGLARGQTYYPLISFQISKTLQVCCN